MVKAMIFIDGSWMFHNRRLIKDMLSDEDYDIDYQKIPLIIRNHLQDYIGTDVDVVRTFFFGSIPINRPGYDIRNQKAFFEMLAEKCYYETEIYEIDFRQDPHYKPKEKCVDVALTTSMMFYGMFNNSYDIAVLVAGDYDYLPLMKKIRQLGKRTLLVGLKSLTKDMPSPTSPKLIQDSSLFDFPVLYLNDYLSDIRLKLEEYVRVCDSCKQRKNTTYTGHPFYCDDCRKEYSEKQRGSERPCDTCGKIETTTWNGLSFYCEDCRAAHNSSGY